MKVGHLCPLGGGITDEDVCFYSCMTEGQSYSSNACVETHVFILVTLSYLHTAYIHVAEVNESRFFYLTFHEHFTVIGC